VSPLPAVSGRAVSSSASSVHGLSFVHALAKDTEQAAQAQVKCNRIFFGPSMRTSPPMTDGPHLDEGSTSAPSSIAYDVLPIPRANASTTVRIARAAAISRQRAMDLLAEGRFASARQAARSIVVHEKAIV